LDFLLQWLTQRVIQKRKRGQEDGREKRRNGEGDVEISPKKDELSLGGSEEKV
jgi:hypothetical protein